MGWGEGLTGEGISVVQINRFTSIDKSTTSLAKSETAKKCQVLERKIRFAKVFFEDVHNIKPGMLTHSFKIVQGKFERDI